MWWMFVWVIPKKRTKMSKYKNEINVKKHMFINVWWSFNCHKYMFIICLTYDTHTFMNTCLTYGSRFFMAIMFLNICSPYVEHELQFYLCISCRRCACLKGIRSYLLALQQVAESPSVLGFFFLVSASDLKLTHCTQFCENF